MICNLECEIINSEDVNDMTDEEKIIIDCPNSNFKRYILNLQHERDELRKYLIDICKLLDIDTRQSLLEANCLEFYAVLSSTADNKIKELAGKLECKEQECEELNSDNRHFVNMITSLELLTDRYEQILDEIKDIYRTDDSGDYDFVKRKILNLIREVKGVN